MPVYKQGMSSTDTIIKIFNLIDSFKTNIVGIFRQLDKPEHITKVSMYYDKLCLYKRANARMVIETIVEKGVKPYAEHILTRDESFILREVDDATDKVDDPMFIREIRDVWDLLSPEVKTNIWNFIIAICKLSEKVVGTHYLDS